MAGSLSKQGHFIFTGVPGVGKTTLVKSIVQELNRNGLECCGFFTEEVRSSGRRIGFDVVTTSGQRGQLARVGDDEPTVGRQKVYRVGQYVVNLISFEQTALPILLQSSPRSREDSVKNVFVIDEVGKMEMFSQSFIQAIEKLISNKNNIIVATIPVPKGKPIPLVEKIRNGPFSQLYEVTRQNRDNLLSEVLPELMSCIRNQRDR